MLQYLDILISRLAINYCYSGAVCLPNKTMLTKEATVSKSVTTYHSTWYLVLVPWLIWLLTGLSLQRPGINFWTSLWDSITGP